MSKVTHGSDARSYAGSSEPEHSLNSAKLSAHVVPFVERDATSPRAPPLDHRSCWNTPMRLCGGIGLTATNGSTSVFG